MTDYHDQLIQALERHQHGRHYLEQHLEELQNQIMADKSRSLARTCDELESYNPSRWPKRENIDPDGKDGDTDIEVVCEAGSTLIEPGLTEIAGCPEPGFRCWEVIYGDTTYRQLIALSRRSAACRQSVQLSTDCRINLHAQHESWWRDRYNVTHPLSNCGLSVSRPSVALKVA